MPSEEKFNNHLHEIHRSTSGDAEAEPGLMVEVYNHYSGALFSYITKIIPEKEKAEQIIQTAFLQIRNDLASPNIENSTLFISLLNFSRNEAIETLIKNNSPRVNNTSNKALGLNNASVHAFLSKLPIFEKTILALIYFKGFNVDQIAELLRIPVSLIQKKMQAAFHTLQQEYPQSPRKI